jgi:hypothetical protein
MLYSIRGLGGRMNINGVKHFVGAQLLGKKL